MGEWDFKSSFPMRTVCEVTREIHDVVYQHKETLGGDYDKIKKLLNEQIVMQKKIDRRLREYKADWIEKEGLEPNPEYKKIEQMRKDRDAATK